MDADKLEWKTLLDLSHTEAQTLFFAYPEPGRLIAELGSYLEVLGAGLPEAQFVKLRENVWLEKTVRYAPDVTFEGGPVIIFAGAELRCGAYLRGPALIGAGATVGHASEIKNSILFQGAQAPHFNYVGDSIMGYRAHLGAGVILSNYRADHAPVKIAWGDASYVSATRKFGAVLGDYAEIGCQAVLNPGTIVGRQSWVYPLTSARGYVRPRHILKPSGEQAELR